MIARFINKILPEENINICIAISAIIGVGAGIINIAQGATFAAIPFSVTLAAAAGAVGLFSYWLFK